MMGICFKIKQDQGSLWKYREGKVGHELLIVKAGGKEHELVLLFYTTDMSH
jgi:hypothetical protein